MNYFKKFYCKHIKCKHEECELIGFSYITYPFMTSLKTSYPIVQCCFCDKYANLGIWSAPHYSVDLPLTQKPYQDVWPRVISKKMKKH